MKGLLGERLTKDDINAKIVRKGSYKGLRYFITFSQGAWYCAYVVIPKKSVFYKNTNWCDEPLIGLDVHGGVTFTDRHPFVNNRWCVGWDYAHYGDFNGPMIGLFHENVHIWTPEEIENECKCAIDQIVKIDNHEE